MSDHEDEINTPMTASGRTRRHFLKRSALAAAGASAATVLPAMARTATQATAQAPLRSCPDLKAPMKDVDGKVAFITGGDSGIGLGIAQRVEEKVQRAAVAVQASSVRR